MLTPVVCARGRHVLGDAPNDTAGSSLWEYCCECQTFWVLKTGTSEAACPVCDRAAGKRYLCDTCQTLTIESTTPASVKEVILSALGTPQPACPGCNQSQGKVVVTHDCATYGAKFVSARATCPFCKSAIVKPPVTATTGQRPAVAGFDSHESKHRSRVATKVILTFAAAVIVLVLVPGLILLASFAIRGNATNSNADVRSATSPPPGMVYVPGGTFMMGEDRGDEYQRPAHRVAVQPFFIDVHEVTCGEYGQFVRTTGHATPSGWGTQICRDSELPVTGIDWYDARTYAAWANKRLPTEEEWEFAARGTDRGEYPWGDDWNAQAANAGNSSAGRLVAVGLYPKGQSPFGVMDMIGNAWEWTASDLQPYPGAHIANLPSGPRKIIRGGSWATDDPRDWTTTTFRGFALPSGGRDYSKIGFRCVKDTAKEK
jgi:formylglycine-generating enzyme required for sulfatase activity